MQFGFSIDSFPCFTRLNHCVAHCSTDSIHWVHHSREEGSLDYDSGFVRLQIHMNFDTIIHRQQDDEGLEDAQQRAWQRLVVLGSHSAGDGAAVPGMAVQRRGWPHRAGVGGGDALH
jgi:hypothetical protein